MAVEYIIDKIKIIPSGSECIKECQFTDVVGQEQSNYYIPAREEIREVLKRSNEDTLDGDCYVNLDDFKYYVELLKTKVMPYRSFFYGKCNGFDENVKKVIDSKGLIPRLYYTGKNFKYLSFKNDDPTVEAIRHLIFPKITVISITKAKGKYELSFNLADDSVETLYNKCKPELSKVLKYYYDLNKYTGVHLFGFDYFNVLKGQNESIKSIVTSSEISESYDVEVRSGMNIRQKLEERGISSLGSNKVVYSERPNEDLISKDELVYSTGIKTNYKQNRIIFGAPGTGKSYTLNEEKDKLLDNVKNFERVTFHPDYSYANFVGSYKPVSIYNKELKKKEIEYKYVPGPFMRTLVKALKSGMSDNPEIQLLIIEEINRANVAAVFGDVFQLLDRKNGVSEYPIQTSEDMRQYLADELNLNPEDCDEIKIPDNMYIWATMNSADQGVYPMDTAFKRRWDFTYIGINDAEEKIKDKTIVLNGKEYKWNSIRKGINETLSNLNINEDKLLGPFFINMDKIDNNEEFDEIFKSKVLMYLFEDAGKQRRSKLFKDTLKVYSSICEEYDNNKLNIFMSDILNIIEEYEKE